MSSMENNHITFKMYLALSDKVFVVYFVNYQRKVTGYWYSLNCVLVMIMLSDLINS